MPLRRATRDPRLPLTTTLALRGARFVAIILVLAGLHGVAAELTLLQDSEFRHGFRILAPKMGERRVVGPWLGEDTNASPAWDLVQWNSRFPLEPLRAPAGGPRQARTNAAKWVVMDHGTLMLGVDSRPEYGNHPRRAPSEPWVHLLVEQTIPDCPSLSELRSLPLRLSARLIECETFRPDGYTPDLHAAQFQVVLTLGNTRRGSAGFGDFLWFVVPLFDDRHPQPPRYVNQDFADPSAKLIFNPGTEVFTTRRLRDGEWVPIDRDLLPLLKEALAEAWRLGYLAGSKDPADYRLTTINLGWEVPGLNRASLALRGLNLRAVTLDR